MKKSTILWIIVVLIVIAVIWWWAAMSTTAVPATAPETTPSSTTSGAGNLTPLVLNTGNSESLGVYLVASNGMTLYKYTKDSTNTTTCYGQCAALWPPYTVSADTSLAGGDPVNGAIATIARTDGTMQVTYNGVPLYYWAKDAKPGDTTGQNVGGVWFVVKP